jgi:hypothetical protein
MLISRYNTDSDETERNEEIQKIENKWSFQFSDDYKQFLIKYNGGETIDTIFRGNKIKSDIIIFFGISKDIVDNLLYYFDLELGEKLLSNKMIAIAKNSFGDYYAIDISRENNGRIYFCYHDRDECKLIANSFKEFICKCRSEKIGYIRSIEERKRDMINAGKGDKITEVKIACWQKEIDKYKDIVQEEVIL